MSVFWVEGWLNIIVTFVLLAIAIFAFVSGLLYSAASYHAADKLTKQGWCLILGLAVLIELLPIVGILRIAAIVAPLVYLADVRPALAGLYRRR